MRREEFKAIRQSFDFSQYEWGLALGYAGNHATIRKTVDRYEKGGREIPGYLSRLASMYHEHGIPEEYDPKAGEVPNV